VIPLEGTTPRAVGLATPRRGQLSSPARATIEVIRAVVEAEVPERLGLRLVPGRAGGDDGLIAAT